MSVFCRHCGTEVTPDESEFYPGFGRLCPDCDDRARVVLNERGICVSATLLGESDV